MLCPMSVIPTASAGACMRATDRRSALSESQEGRSPDVGISRFEVILYVSLPRRLPRRFAPRNDMWEARRKLWRYAAPLRMPCRGVHCTPGGIGRGFGSCSGEFVRVGRNGRPMVAPTKVGRCGGIFGYAAVCAAPGIMDGCPAPQMWGRVYVGELVIMRLHLRRQQRERESELP